MNTVTLNNDAQNILDTASLITERFPFEMITQPSLPADPNAENIALQAANKLFLQLKTLKTLTPEAFPLEQLQQELIQEIQHFEKTLKLSGMPAMLVLVYRYLLCAVVDEAVLSSRWGKHHLWGRHPLLGIFHQDNQGGEKFFILLDKMQQSPQRNLAVLEFIYFCLSLGFAGKYQLQSNGLQQLEIRRQQLYTIIRQHQTQPVVALSADYQPPVVMSKKSRLWRRYFLIVLFFMLIVFSVCKIMLMHQAKPISNSLQQLTHAYTNLEWIAP